MLGAVQSGMVVVVSDQRSDCGEWLMLDGEYAGLWARYRNKAKDTDYMIPTSIEHTWSAPGTLSLKLQQTDGGQKSQVETLSYMKLKQFLVTKGCTKQEVDRCSGKPDLLHLWDTKKAADLVSGAAAESDCGVLVEDAAPEIPAAVVGKLVEIVAGENVVNCPYSELLQKLAQPERPLTIRFTEPLLARENAARSDPAAVSACRGYVV